LVFSVSPLGLKTRQLTGMIVCDKSGISSDNDSNPMLMYRHDANDQGDYRTTHK